MQAPTLSPSQFDLHRARTRKLVAAVGAAGVALFGYGVGAAGLEQGPAGPAMALPYLLMAIGLLLATLMGLVLGWFRRQEEPRPLPRRATLVIGLLAPLVSTAVLAGVHWLQVGEGAFGSPLLGWLLLGQVALGLQLFVGATEPARRRRRALLAGPVVVFAFSVAILGGAGVTVGSALVESAGLAGAFVVVGGGLALLGHLLVRRPRYHRIA